LFSLYDDPVAIPLRPRISMDQAAAVVDARMGYLHPVAQRAELIVWYRPTYPGRQVLLWSFENICDASAPADTDPFPVARVDAMTGELLDLPVADEIAAPGTKHSTEQVKGGSPSKPAPLHIKVLIEIDLAALKNATAPPTVFQTARARKH